MLALNRHRRLLDLLHQRGSLRTAEVASLMDVAEETIRRDFEKLEREGQLKRSHGGAVRLESVRREFSAAERAVQHTAEKQRIAAAAARHVEPGQTVYLDGSTTVLEFARVLPDMALTILTNSLPVVSVLAERPAIRVVVIGGDLQAGAMSCTGSAAEQMLRQFRIDVAFLSCRGIDARRGLSDASEGHANLKRCAVAQAEATILLADASKSGLASSCFFARLDQVTRWITDKAPPAPLRRTVTVELARG